MEAARLLEMELDEKALFNVNLEEISANRDIDAPEYVGSATRKSLEQSAEAREMLRDFIRRSLASLDVLECDVAQFLRGCYGCGAILEGTPTHACPVCSMLSVEFERSGPFYSSMTEHLGQLKPVEIIDILQGIPDEVENAIKNVDAPLLIVAISLKSSSSVINK